MASMAHGSCHRGSVCYSPSSPRDRGPINVCSVVATIEEEMATGHSAKRSRCEAPFVPVTMQGMAQLEPRRWPGVWRIGVTLLSPVLGALLCRTEQRAQVTCRPEELALPGGRESPDARLPQPPAPPANTAGCPCLWGTAFLLGAAPQHAGGRQDAGRRGGPQCQLTDTQGGGEDGGACGLWRG